MPNGNGRNGNGRNGNGKVSREDYLRRMKKESKEREPKVVESLKAGVKSALRMNGRESAKAAPTGKPTQRDPAEYFSGKKWEKGQREARRQSGLED